MAATLVAIADGLALLNAALETAATIGPIVQKAVSEGRTTFTPEEWAEIQAPADAADAKFDSDLTKGA